jgi:hypothetical protein
MSPVDSIVNSATEALNEAVIQLYRCWQKRLVEMLGKVLHATESYI